MHMVGRRSRDDLKAETHRAFTLDRLRRPTTDLRELDPPYMNFHGSAQPRSNLAFA